MSSWTITQRRALAIIPKVAGSASFVSSAAIAVSILRNKTRRKHIYHRLVLGISYVP